jgi:hypothetical protein
MEAVYIIIENGMIYGFAYNSYALALAVVHTAWNDEVQQQGEDTCSVINLPEDPSGRTILYVEKGINIEIRKLNILR